MTTTIYNGLNYSTKEINTTFLLKVKGIDNLGRKVNKLVGVAGLILLIGVEMVNKLLAKAFKKMYYADKVECKLRRGIKISFYCH